MPSSPLTPSSEPVLPRTLPASGVSASWSISVPLTPGDRKPVPERAHTRLVAEPERVDEGPAGHLVAPAEPGPVGEPEAVVRHAQLGQLGDDRGGAGRGRALLRRPCTPSSLVNISALRLSLELSIDEIDRVSGWELDLGDRGALGRRDAAGAGTHLDAARGEQARQLARGVCAGSSTTTLRGVHERKPSLTVSAPIGPTSPSVWYDSSQVGT